jgi:ATP-binding cassette subfamily F protein 3
MLTISEVSKAYAGRVLFAEASLQVNRQDRIGLVGPNGAGKSTLFALVLRQETPDTGKITIDRRMSVGYLPQECAPAGGETVLELAMAISPEMAELQRQLRAWETTHTIDTDEYHAVQARFDEMGGYGLEPRAKQILNGLGFRQSDFHRPTRELSGGWVMRVRLAQLLVQGPDLLMLDEPTNHLDLEALLWFQAYLKVYRGAILLISHDREFLDQLVESIVEIRQGRLIRYQGNYEDYLAQRQAQVEQHEAAYKNQQREIAHLMEFVDRFRAKNTKATQAQSKLKQIERMEKIEAPERAAPTFDFVFPQPVRSGLRVISLRDVAHAYGSIAVYQNLNFQAERGQRIVLVGPNGAGKSTLLKLLAGVLPIQSGIRELGHNVKGGYYAQHRLEMLRAEHTALDEALDTPQRITEQSVRTVLGSFGFRGDDVFKPVSVLSGGEKSRLALVKLLLDPPNLLLMDEPTTHLDMDGVAALIAALQQFAGTLIFISHDVFFIRALANHVVQVRGGQLAHFTGNYQYYLDKTSAVSAQAGLTAGDPDGPERPAGEASAGAKTRELRRERVAQQDARARVRRAQNQAVSRLETEITQLEERRDALTTELQDPETYQKNGRVVAINVELAEIHERLPQLTAAWEVEAGKLASIDAE